MIIREKVTDDSHLEFFEDEIQENIGSQEDFEDFQRKVLFYFEKKEKTEKVLGDLEFEKNRIGRKREYTIDSPTVGELKQLSHAVHIAATVTAQSRLVMYPFLSRLYKNGLLCYSNTDSIIFLKNKKSDFIKKIIHSTKLGFFKVETEGNYGTFFDVKMYSLFPKEENIESMDKHKGLIKNPFENTKSLSNKERFLKLKNNYFKKNQNVSFSEKRERRLKRDSKNIYIETVDSSFFEQNTEKFGNYRSKKYENDFWISTESLILDLLFQEISLNLMYIYKHQKFYGWNFTMEGFQKNNKNK